MSNPNDVRTVRCAGCGATRQEANHWFVVSMIDRRFWCEPLESWAERHSRLALKDSPVCGQACGQKLFEKWMDESRNAQAPKVAQAQAR